MEHVSPSTPERDIPVAPESLPDDNAERIKKRLDGETKPGWVADIETVDYEPYDELKRPVVVRSNSGELEPNWMGVGQGHDKDGNLYVHAVHSDGRQLWGLVETLEQDTEEYRRSIGAQTFDG